MKLYFEDVYFELDFKLNDTKKLLYSDEGLFYFKDNILYKKNIEYKTTNYHYNNYEILIDNSIIHNDEVYYYLPYNNIEIQEYYYEYIINKNIKLIKTTYFNETEFYFNVTILNDPILKKIISFINKNNIKNNKYV